MAVNLSIFNSKVIRFVARLSLFLVLMAIVDQTLGRVINHYYRKTFYGPNWPKENWLLSKPFDVVILGSSRAFRHYVPTILSQETGYTAFNGGENGQYLFYAYAVEQLLLEKHPPRVLVLDLLPNYIIRLQDPRQEMERLNTLAPYADNLHLREFLIDGHWYGGLPYLSLMYRFNSRLVNILANVRNTWWSELDNGYVFSGTPPFRPTNQFDVDLMPKERIVRDEFKIEVLKKFISSAQQKNVRVILSFSPTLERLTPTVLELLDEYDAIAREFGIPFVKITSNDHPDFMDQKLFMDYIHMNSVGADKFSLLFSDSLKPILTTNVAQSGSVSITCQN